MMSESSHSWEDELEEVCLAELLRRDAMYSKFRADRLRLPVAESNSLKDGDHIQCFHDNRSGFADWAHVTQRGRSWYVQLISWKERKNTKAPPPIFTLGALLDYYPELRINTKRRRANSREVKTASFVKEKDDSWLAQCNESCYLELSRRCLQNYGWRLRFRLPNGINKRPAPGDILQMFHDRLTGFSTYGSLHFDEGLSSHFLRVFPHGPDSSETYVEVPLGAVLDQHAEIRVCKSVSTASSSL